MRMPSLKDMCYLQIKDNFFYTDFLGLKVIVDKTTGFFNATQLCSSGGKQYDNWFFNERTQNLYSYLSSLDKRELKYDIKGDDEISGTYIHEDLVLDLTSWMSPKFYIRCQKIILDISSNRTSIG